MLAAAGARVRFPGARRGHARDDVLHDRHDRSAEGRLLQPSPARAAHARRRAGARARAARVVRRARRLHADHADVPRPRVGPAVRRDHARREAGLSGPLRAGRAARADRARRRHVLALRADDPADDAREPRAAATANLRGWKVIIGGSALPAAARPRGGRARGSTSSAATACRKRARSSRSRTSRRPPGAGTPSAALPYRCRAGRPIPFVQLRIVDADMNDVRARRREPGRGRRARAVAHAGLPRRARALGGAVARRLAAHGRRRRDRQPTAISRSSTASRTS